MTFDEFELRNLTRSQAANGFAHQPGAWSTSDWLVAVMGELGEAANVAKKLNRIRDNIPGNKEAYEELRAKLRKEIGDTGVYLVLTSQHLGFSLLDAMREVYNAKSKEIGYVEPDLGFAKTPSDDLLARALKALAEYEAWEADLVMNGDWSGECVRLTHRQHEAMMTLQKRRNAVVREARDRGLLPAAGGMAAAEAAMQELIHKYHHPVEQTQTEEASK